MQTQSQTQGSPISIKMLGKLVRKMRIRPKDIVLIKSKSGLDNEKVIREFGEVCKNAGITDIIFVVVDDFDDLSAIDAGLMSKKGWFHVSTLGKMLHVPESEGKSDTLPELVS